jgi:hypothetical protein
MPGDPEPDTQRESEIENDDDEVGAIQEKRDVRGDR